jgi:hypothetical protein
MNCGTTTSQHSKECIAEHTAACAGGFFGKPFSMDTAPKDGTEILVYFIQHGWKTVSWTDSDGDPSSEYALWHIDDHKHGPYPVRGYRSGDEKAWMPLPPPPVTLNK